MTESTRFRMNSPNVICETFEDEVILLNFETGSYYSLDKSGTEIWGLIEKGATTTGIIDEISSRYDGSREDIGNAVKEMITWLSAKDLIVTDESGGPESTADNETGTPTTQNGAKPVFEEPTIREYTDMQELLLLDPIHEVDEAGWPFAKTAPSTEED